MLKIKLKKEDNMKNLKMYLATTTIALIAIQAHAGSDVCLWRIPENMCGPMTQISCSYQSANGHKQEINFKLAEKGDFRHISGSSVQLKMYGAKKSTTFTVQKEVEGAITTTHLSAQGRFFINDIILSFEQNTRTKTLFNSVKGKWIVDHPPVIEMDCSFRPNH